MLDFARQVEDSGIDVLLLRDHFSAGPFGQQLAPFSGLAAAAAATTRLRVGTLVLSNDFRHPAIVAHEAASLHLLSGGRFELGIGAGWYQPKYDAAGITFEQAGRLPAKFDAKVSVLREAAGDRFGRLELSAIGTFVVTQERRAGTEDLITRRGWSGIEVEQVWQMPTVFIGSPDQIRADLHAQRERFGLSYLIAGEDSQPALAEVIGGL